MRSTKTGVASGCVIWVLLVGVLGSCMVPGFLFIGTLTSFTDFAIVNTGTFLCPEGTAPRSHSYQTTTRDEFGNSRPSTAYELHCEDSNGEVVMRDAIQYALIWNAMFAGIGLLAAVGFSFLLAAPAGALISRILDRNKPSPETRG